MRRRLLRAWFLVAALAALLLGPERVFVAWAQGTAALNRTIRIAASTPYTWVWPAANAAGVARNDGTGNWSWVARAGASTDGGAATTATALAANGANCAAGNYPLGVDASGAAETCTAITSTITLLVAANGSTVSTLAENVSTVAISGLTAKDRLLVLFVVGSTTQATAQPSLYNSTDSVTISALTAPPLAAGTVVFGNVGIHQRQTATTAIVAGVSAVDQSSGSLDRGTAATFTTAWTGAWTLALRHGGVTSGGTFDWSWAVYKVAGQ